MTVASLPMYDLPEARAATDSWWQGLARAFRSAGIKNVPVALDRRASHAEVWRQPDLLFSQTCGYPLTHALRGQVRLVATPCYAAPGCEGANYPSFVIVRDDHAAREIGQLRGARCAVNGLDSQSGYSALRTLVAPYAREGRFFGEIRLSGGHLKSIQMVSLGQVEVAAIDCVTHAMLTRHRPAAIADVRVLCETESAPNLPYVTRHDADEEMLGRLHAGLLQAFADPALAEARAALLLDGCEFLPLTAYDRILEIERKAIELGYPQLA